MIPVKDPRPLGKVVATGPCYVRGLLPPTGEVETVTDETRSEHSKRERERFTSSTTRRRTR